MQVNKNLVRVNKKQESNPLLKFNRFQYTLVDDLIEDYELNSGTLSLLFLALSYHLTYPLYLPARLDELYKQKRSGKHRILLVLIDSADEQNSVNGVMLQAMKFETTVVMCWSFEEAA